MKTTFEELSIKHPPYVTEYREKFGKYPTMQLYRETALPVRFSEGPAGRFTPLLTSSFTPAHQFEVVGITVPPSEDSRDICIVLKNPKDSEREIILPLHQFSTRMYVTHNYTPKRKGWVKL